MNSLISFAFGVLCTLPLAFARRIKTNREIQKKQEQKNQVKLSDTVNQQSQQKPKTTAKAKKQEAKKTETSKEENTLT